MRISGGENFGEREGRGEQGDGEDKPIGVANAHSHGLQIILSQAKTGSVPGELMAQLHYASLAEIAQKIRSKELTPQEVTQHHLQRIETLQPKLNAFACVDAENAMRDARAAGEALRRSGEGIGPLHGVPLTVKSCIDVAGWPCAASSMLRKDYR